MEERSKHEDISRANSTKKDASSYRFGKVLGEGSFSTVYLAKEIENGKEYAIKVCQKSLILKEKKQEYVKREKSALHLLHNCPGIISLFCTFQDRTKLFFVLSFAANGELLKYMKHGPLSRECTKFYAAELLLCIEEIHRKNIIHRDLKPENLLLNRSMHLMIADFGSSKILPDDYEYEIVQSEIDRSRAEESNESDDSENEKPQRRPKRRASFVGTAQYVSPEILKGNAAHLSTDLWAYGCIVYQMLAGVPPFRGGSEYLIFQKIIACEFDLPENFDEDAKDLIKQLLRFDPKERLGSKDSSEIRYSSIRKHGFFDGIKWENVRDSTPCEMTRPTRSGDSDEESFTISDDIEPGLCQQRETSLLLQGDFASNEGMSRDTQNQSSMSTNLEKLLEQQKKNEWNIFVEPTELILKYGFVNKRKGLFARRRMLLLTNTPRLIYIDPNTNIKKGEIPFDASLACEPKNFKIFYVHTPNRIYYLEDSDGNALNWCETIEKARQKYIKTS